MADFGISAECLETQWLTFIHCKCFLLDVCPKSDMLWTSGPNSPKYLRNHRVCLTTAWWLLCKALNSCFVLTLVFAGFGWGAECQYFLHLAGDGCTPHTIQHLHVLLLDLWLALFFHCLGTNTSEIQRFQLAEWMKPLKELTKRAALGSVKRLTPSRGW